MAFERYALYSHPYATPYDGRTEVCCTECREHGLPMVVWTNHKANMSVVTDAIIRHEETYHIAIAALAVAV
jgi:hypothetical protein